MNISKRILTTQLISYVFSVLSLLLAAFFAWFLDSNFGKKIHSDSVFFIPISISILLLILFSIIIKKFLDGKWRNLLLIVLPFYLYFFSMLLVCGRILFRSSGSDNLGLGVLLTILFFIQIISLSIASVLGTIFKRRKYLTKGN